jgi:RNA polymerase sigma-70 factor (family 1)
LNDKKLKEKFIRGNKKAFDIIYADYSQAMYMLCLRYTRNEDEAADILQDAFIKIYEKRAQFNPIYPLASWIKKIVMNEAINHLRLNKRFELIEDDHYFEAEEEEDFEIANLSDNRLMQALKQILNDLPDGYKMVFNMYVFENLKHQEIAEYLDISVNTSKSQLSKARKYLKKKLDEQGITRTAIINE